MACFTKRLASAICTVCVLVTRILTLQPSHLAPLISQHHNLLEEAITERHEPDTEKLILYTYLAEKHGIVCST
jgi:hypothetical protein